MEKYLAYVYKPGICTNISSNIIHLSKQKKIAVHEIQFYLGHKSFNIFTKGEQSNIIVPPSWIIKLPRKGSFKSSLRKTSRKREVSKKKSKEKEQKAFVIKAVPTTKITPVLVFINPKSGGNQVSKKLFTW